jgi:quinol monooxygenase YgiN
VTPALSHPPARAIRKFARITGKPRQAPVLREALQTLEAATRREPGCREFTFFQALSDPDAFVLVEEFADQAAWDAHMAMPHTQAFFRAQLVVRVETTAIG